jgi:hypothetical protein
MKLKQNKLFNLCIIMTVIVVIATVIFIFLKVEEPDNNPQFWDTCTVRTDGISLELPKNGSIPILIGPFTDKDNHIVENAKVTLFVLNRTLINYTDARGIVVFEFDFIIPKDKYQLKVEAEGYEPTIFRIELEIYD